MSRSDSVANVTTATHRHLLLSKIDNQATMWNDRCTVQDDLWGLLKRRLLRALCRICLQLAMTEYSDLISGSAVRSCGFVPIGDLRTDPIADHGKSLLLLGTVFTIGTDAEQDPNS
jgi:hypothetical protein